MKVVVNLAVAGLCFSNQALAQSQFDKTVLPQCAVTGIDISDPSPPLRIFFDFGSSVPREEFRDAFAFLSAFLKADSRNVVVLMGNADAAELRRRYYTLDKDRADAIKQKLLQIGGDRDRIFVEGYATSRKLVPSEDAEAINRRVDTRLYGFFPSAQEQRQAAKRNECRSWVMRHCFAASPQPHADDALCRRVWESTFER